MTTLHEAAYPRFKPDSTAKELQDIYSPTEAERLCVAGIATGLTRLAPPKTDCIRFHPPEGRRTMPVHSKHTIQKLQNTLQERLDHLLKAIQGTNVTNEEERMHGLHGPHAKVHSDDVRIAVDDFQTILKEIKATLGKR